MYLTGSGGEVVETKAEVLIDLVCRGGQTELVHNTERSMGIAAPSVRA